jgi:uncharacterized protein YuzE
MVFEYYPDTDMLYIKLADGTSTESEEAAPGIVPDFDEHNRVIGVEIEDASKFIDLSRLELRALPVANLILSERVPAERDTAIVSNGGLSYDRWEESPAPAPIQNRARGSAVIHD